MNYKTTEIYTNGEIIEPSYYLDMQTPIHIELSDVSIIDFDGSINKIEEEDTSTGIEVSITASDYTIFLIKNGYLNTDFKDEDIDKLKDGVILWKYEYNKNDFGGDIEDGDDPVDVASSHYPSLKPKWNWSEFDVILNQIHEDMVDQYIDFTFKINSYYVPTKAILKVNNASKIYGNDDPPFSYTVVDSEGNEITEKIADIDIYRTNSEEEIGYYPDVLTATIQNINSNYIITEIEPGDFEILPIT